MGLTSIPVEGDVRDRLAQDKPDNLSWSVYLDRLYSETEVTITGDYVELIEAIDELSEKTKNHSVLIEELRNRVDRIEEVMA